MAPLCREKKTPRLENETKWNITLELLLFLFLTKKKVVTYLCHCQESLGDRGRGPGEWRRQGAEESHRSCQPAQGEKYRNSLIVRSDIPY